MKLTHATLTRLRWSAITPKVRALLAAQGIEEERIEPWTPDTDLEVHLGGEYRGVWLQVGDGYVSVCRKVGDGFHFFDVEPGRDLLAALNGALNAR